MRADEASRKISGAVIFENMLKTQPTDIGRERHPDEIREAGAMPGIEFGPPVDIDVTGAGFRPAVRIGRNQDQPLLEQGFDLEARAALRGVHDPDIETTLDEPLHEIRLEADLGA